jgi:hypothetical protein
MLVVQSCPYFATILFYTASWWSQCHGSIDGTEPLWESVCMPILAIGRGTPAGCSYMQRIDWFMKLFRSVLSNNILIRCIGFDAFTSYSVDVRPIPYGGAVTSWADASTNRPALSIPAAASVSIMQHGHSFLHQSVPWRWCYRIVLFWLELRKVALFSIWLSFSVKEFVACNSSLSSHFQMFDLFWAPRVFYCIYSVS